MKLYATHGYVYVDIMRKCEGDRQQTVQRLTPTEAAALLRSLAQVLWEMEQEGSRLYQMLQAIEQTLAG